MPHGWWRFDQADGRLWVYAATGERWIARRVARDVARDSRAEPDEWAVIEVGARATAASVARRLTPGHVHVVEWRGADPATGAAERRYVVCRVDDRFRVNERDSP